MTTNGPPEPPGRLPLRRRKAREAGRDPDTAMTRAERTEYERTVWQPRWRRGRIEELKAQGVTLQQIRDEMLKGWRPTATAPGEREAIERLFGLLEEQIQAGAMTDIVAVRALHWIIRDWAHCTGIDKYLTQALPNSGIDKMAYGGMAPKPNEPDAPANARDAFDWRARLIELGWTPPEDKREALPGLPAVSKEEPHEPTAVETIDVEASE